MKFAYLSLLLLNPLVALADDVPPVSIFGKYENKHTVYTNCYATEQGAPCLCGNGKFADENGYCHNEAIDTLLIQRDKRVHNAITVELDTAGQNAYTCSYDGNGHWEKHADRAVANSDINDFDQNCSIALIFKNNLAYVVTRTDNACRQFCGARASMDGMIFKKATSH